MTQSRSKDSLLMLIRPEIHLSNQDVIAFPLLQLSIKAPSIIFHLPSSFCLTTVKLSTKKIKEAQIMTNQQHMQSLTNLSRVMSSSNSLRMIET